MGNQTNEQKVNLKLIGIVYVVELVTLTQVYHSFSFLLDLLFVQVEF